jgi:hypothetical protein
MPVEAGFTGSCDFHSVKMMKASWQVNPYFIRYVRGFGEPWLGIHAASSHVKVCWKKWARLQNHMGVSEFPPDVWDNVLVYDEITGAAAPTLL